MMLAFADSKFNLMLVNVGKAMIDTSSSILKQILTNLCFSYLIALMETQILS